MPLVSVVIPTYNGADWIAETLRSVFSQTVDADDMEVVVVDDGSTDDTVEQIAPFRDRVRLIQQKNRGVGAARNRGLDAARGTYVAPLDHDDLWRPEKLETQISYLENRPDFVGCVVPWAVPTRPDEPVFERGEICEDDGTIRQPIRFLPRRMFWTTSASLLRRSALNGVRYGTERGTAEDLEAHVQLFARGPVGVAGTEIRALYRVHESNHSCMTDDYGLRGVRRLRALRDGGAFREFDAQTRRAIDLALAEFIRGVLVRLLRDGRRGRAWSYARAQGDVLVQAPHLLPFTLALPVLSVLPRTVVEWCFRSDYGPLETAAPEGASRS